VTPRPAWLGYVMLVLTTAAWGGAWVTARLAAHELPPLTVTWGRFALAALALLPLRPLLERGRRVTLHRGDWLTLLGMAATGIAGYTIVFMEGVARAPASDGAIITPGLVGALAMTFGAIFARRMPRRREIAGAALAAAGVALVGYSAFRTADAAGDVARIIGDWLFVLAAILWGAYTVLGQRLAGRVPAVTGVLLACLLGVAILTPFAWAIDGPSDPLSWPRTGLFNVAYLGLVATAFGFVTYYLAVRILTLNRAMPGMGLVPLFGVLGAAAFLGETMGPLHILGGFLVVAGIVVPARGPAPR
jgi:drug/metabolite transporter (DMT)-like permease